jgi:hypothetical protein
LRLKEQQIAPMNTKMPSKASIASTAFLLSSLATQSSYSGEFPMEAKTNDGSAVTLYEDGTWRPKTLQLDHRIIRKGDFANQLVKSRFGFFEFWVDPKIWHREQDSGAFEFSYAHNDNEAGCGVIPERVQMTQDALRNAVLKNVQATDSKAKIAQESKAFVNGLGGQVVELNATVEGLFITYYTFLWTGSKGTVRIACWTASAVIDVYRPVFNDFFGGFMLTED